MLKQIIALIILSLIVIFCMPFIQQGLHAAVAAHNWIDEQLKQVFSAGAAGNTIRELLALLAIPALAGLLPAGVYWLIKRHWFPWTLEIIWVVWLMEATALVLMYVPVTN